MGTVYRAEQREPVRRDVAVKLIAAGISSRRIVARFDAERQALARMHHPGIAEIYDAGTAPDGRPWFAMELVVRRMPLHGARRRTGARAGRREGRRRLHHRLSVQRVPQHRAFDEISADF